MLISASQLFEQLPFAMENEHFDSDPSGNSLQGEPSTSGTAAIVSIFLPPINFLQFFGCNCFINSFKNTAQ